MSNRAKDLRKQQRNIVQETLPQLLASEVGVAIKKALSEEMNSRLDNINAYCADQLTKMDKRAKDIQGFLMREVKGNMHTTMSDMDVTIEALTRVLADSGLVVEDLYEKVAKRKPEIINARRIEAEARMKADIEANKAAQTAADEAAKAAAAQPEAPAETAQT